MGIRADFYVGKNKEAEWIGSVAYGGYKFDENKKHPIAMAKTEEEYRKAVESELSKRDDATTPEMGWPWPWNDSGMTDYAYYFKDGLVGCEDWESYPDMSKVKNVTYGSRSGIMIVGVPK